VEVLIKELDVSGISGIPDKTRKTDVIIIEIAHSSSELMSIPVQQFQYPNSKLEA